MTAIESPEELLPSAHVTMVYQGPTAPHWELQTHFGDEKLIDEFWRRVHARLLLLPKHDPQFRRNRERVNRDAERERIVCDWNLGEGDAETTATVVQDPADVAEQETVDQEVVDQENSEPDPEGAETASGEAVDQVGAQETVPAAGDEEE